MNKSSTSCLTLTAMAAGFLLATSGYALAADSQRGDTDALLEILMAKKTEYFCCENNDSGTCLPATRNSKCPDGMTKVVNETCEKGERGCNL